MELPGSPSKALLPAADLPEDDSVSILCMKGEEHALDWNPVSTVTFFKTASDEVDYRDALKARITEVVKANPWLLCRLVLNKRQHRHLRLVHPSSPSDTEISEVVHIHKDSAALGIHWYMAYTDLVKAMEGSSAELKGGSASVGKPWPRTNFTVVPVAGGDRGFALIFSLCHVVGDGHTYYQILNMLSKDVPVRSLTAARQQDFPVKSQAATGREQAKWCTSGARIYNAAKWMLFGKPPQRLAYFVDLEQVAAEKERATGGGGFVSANDIITSQFFNLVEPRVGCMVINWRNRLPGVGNDLAGNYRGELLYDAEGYREARSIRRSLNPVGSVYKGHVNPLPGTCETMGCTQALVTNWATFAEDVVLQGCEQHLHLPIQPQVAMETCIIFRPRAKQLGVLYFGTKIGHRELTAAASVIGQAISSAAVG